MTIDKLIKKTTYSTGFYNVNAARNLYKKGVSYHDLSTAKWEGYIRNFPKYKDVIMRHHTGKKKIKINRICGYCFAYADVCGHVCPLNALCDYASDLTPIKILEIIKGLHDNHR